MGLLCVETGAVGVGAKKLVWIGSVSLILKFFDSVDPDDVPFATFSSHPRTNDHCWNIT